MFTLLFGAACADTSPRADLNSPTPSNDGTIDSELMLERYAGRDLLIGVHDEGPLLLCFHGAGGSAAGWTRGNKATFVRAAFDAGYSVVCPTSLDRSEGKWSNENTRENPDALAVERLLAQLDLAARPRFVVGHSNGGAFASRFALLASTKPVATQYSNASGVSAFIRNPSYDVPSRFSYADCDARVESADVLENARFLELGGVFVERESLDDLYAAAGDQTCHSFLDTSATTLAFFDAVP